MCVLRLLFIKVYKSFVLVSLVDVNDQAVARLLKSRNFLDASGRPKSCHTEAVKRDLGHSGTARLAEVVRLCVCTAKYCDSC